MPIFKRDNALLLIRAACGYVAQLAGHCCDPACYRCRCNEECPDGEYCCEGVCQAVPCEGCLCEFPVTWRIKIDGIEWMSGGVTAEGPDEHGYCEAKLSGLPEKFAAEFYYARPSIATLEVLGCDFGNWTVIDSHEFDIQLCDARYPGDWNVDGPWPPPGDCACEEGSNPCVPCPDLQVGSRGSSPANGVGVTFTAAVDGEWTNLANWEDADGNSPAGSLPEASDNVTVAGDVRSDSVGFIDVAILTIAAGAEFNVVATCDELQCYGEIRRNSICEGQYGYIGVSGEAFVYGANGGLLAADGGTTFSGSGVNDYEGVVGPYVRFEGNSVNYGTTTGDLTEFFDSSTNSGTVGRDATFNDGASNLGTVSLNATFNDDSINEGTVTGTATFNDDACNNGGTAGTFVPDPPPSC
jgi:hypothetical protein